VLIAAGLAVLWQVQKTGAKPWLQKKVDLVAFIY
jgi:hypothetical protein